MSASPEWLPLLAPLTHTERELRLTIGYWLVVLLFVATVVTALLFQALLPPPAPDTAPPGRRHAAIEALAP